MLRLSCLFLDYRILNFLVTSISQEEVFNLFYETGGHEMTKIYVGILKDLRKTGCLYFILK